MCLYSEVHDLSSSQPFRGSTEEGSNLSQPSNQAATSGTTSHQGIASYIDLASSDKTDDKNYKLEITIRNRKRPLSQTICD